MRVGGQLGKQDFKRDKQLSSGAYGSVWLGHHIETKEQVAIKVSCLPACMPA